MLQRERERQRESARACVCVCVCVSFQTQKFESSPYMYYYSLHTAIPLLRALWFFLAFIIPPLLTKHITLILFTASGSMTFILDIVNIEWGGTQTYKDRTMISQVQ